MQVNSIYIKINQQRRLIILSKCKEYYTIKDTDNDTCYHDNNECVSGKKIKEENKRAGTDQRELCEICEKME